MLGVIVVNYRTPDLALSCIDALDVARQSVPNLRCILVDGGSGDGSSDTIAMGDGASNLLMMGEAGLSVAYHAEPKVRQQAMVAINEGGLDRLLEVVS